MQYDWFIQISVVQVEPLALEARNISLTHIRSCSDKTEILALPLPHIHSGVISVSTYCHTPQPLLSWLLSFFYLFLALYHFYWVTSSKGTGNNGEWEKEWAWEMLRARFELDPPHEHHSQMCFSISANLFLSVILINDKNLFILSAVSSRSDQMALFPVSARCLIF